MFVLIDKNFPLYLIQVRITLCCICEHDWSFLWTSDGCWKLPLNQQWGVKILNGNWQLRREHDLRSRSLGQLSQAPEVPVDCPKPSCCSPPGKPVAGNNQWAITGWEISWWCPLPRPQEGNTPPYGLDVVGIWGPLFVSKGSHQWLVPSFCLNWGGCDTGARLFCHRQPFQTKWIFSHILISLVLTFQGLTPTVQRHLWMWHRLERDAPGNPSRYQFSFPSISQGPLCLPGGERVGDPLLLVKWMANEFL